MMELQQRKQQQQQQQQQQQHVVTRPKVQIKIDFPSEPTPPQQPQHDQQQLQQQQQQQQPHPLQFLEIRVSDFSSGDPDMVDVINDDVVDNDNDPACDDIFERRKRLTIGCSFQLSMSEPTLPTSPPVSTNFLTVPADVHGGSKRRCSFIFDDVSSSGRSRLVYSVPIVSLSL